jgi:hypothetical protein
MNAEFEAYRADFPDLPEAVRVGDVILWASISQSSRSLEGQSVPIGCLEQRCDVRFTPKATWT